MALVDTLLAAIHTLRALHLHFRATLVKSARYWTGAKVKPTVYYVPLRFRPITRRQTGGRASGKQAGPALL
jgi:hypothetical protein